MRTVAISAPNQDVGVVVDAGAVTFAMLDPDGAPVVGSHRLITQDLTGLGDDPEAGDRFGTSLALRAVNGGLDPAMIVGTPRESIGDLAAAGVIDFVFDLGVGQTPYGVRWTEDDLGQAESAEAGERFGAAISFAVDGFTGISKLAVGAPGEDVVHRNAGRVYLIFPNGPTPPPERV